MGQKHSEVDRLRATERSRNGATFLGMGLVIMGLLLNKWSIERLVSPDEYIGSTLRIAAIVIFQISCVVPGLWLLLRRPALALPIVVRRVGVFGVAVGMLVGGYGNWKAVTGILSPTNKEIQKVLSELNASEELILLLTPGLKGLDKGVMDLELPGQRSAGLFAEHVTVVDVAGDALLPLRRDLLRPIATEAQENPLASEARSASLAELRLWRPLLDQVEYFEHAHFKIKDGHFLTEQRDDYEITLLFAGLARSKSGQVAAINSEQTVRWRKQGQSEKNEVSLWRIYDWRTQSFKATKADHPMFVEVLDKALPEPADLARARDSVHERLVVAHLLGKEELKGPHKGFSFPALDQHPGVAVVDLDRDGFDDLYVMEPWGGNMFFHNRGDGAFEEVAAKLGLNIGYYTTSAVFADFDNDGDLDAFLGRAAARSVYLVNEGGRFVDRSDSLVDAPLPYLASSVSAVDYNGDGLLDLYISTYGTQVLDKEGEGTAKGMLRKILRSFDTTLLSEYLPDVDARELYRLTRAKEADRMLSWPGPPNVLLRNAGNGRFAIAKESPELHVFRNTFQATWSDFDGDGDPDVYLANDYAPNNLLRNDGNGKFVDVTEETGTADVGFGMGASWGDYDNDGKQDLYVTNMYSKAGRRITAQIPGLDPRFAQAARGNSLFRNKASGSFDRVSGLTPPALVVEEGGWGWGSQFIDVDNDGFLDIYAVSGYYTAPKEVAKEVDI